MRRSLFALFAFLLVFVTACAPASSQGSQPADCNNADLTVVSGSNARLFLEDQHDGTKGLLSQFKDKSGLNVCIQPMGGPEAVNLKASLLSKSPADFRPGDPAAFIFDSNMYADGLNDQTYVGNTLVGIWLHESTVTRENLTKGLPLSMEQYASMMENGQLKIVTAPAYVSTPASIMFFQTLSSYYGPNNQLSIDQVQDQAAIDYGKKIYDHYVRSAASTSDAIKMVVGDTQNLYDGVVAFESSFLGKNGKNVGLNDPFVFFYFDPSVVSTVTLGRLQLEGKNLEVYSAFADFLVSEEAQIYIAGTGIRPQKDVVDLDTNLFKPEWGLSTVPSVTLVSPPTYSVASKALEVYRNFYKRAKVVEVLVDTSPSQFQNSMTVNVNGQRTDVLRIQAMDMAILKFTNSAWLKENNILPGQNDRFDYYFFSTLRSDLVVSTVGGETDAAGVRLDYFLGPSTGSWDSYSMYDKMTRELNGFSSNGTAIYDSASDMLDLIKEEIKTNPDVDYYIVVLTDGDDTTSSISGAKFYEEWNSFSGKANVTLIGIAFGTEGNSINKDYTAQFGGNTYKGENDAELVEAFKQIIGR